MRSIINFRSYTGNDYELQVEHEDEEQRLPVMVVENRDGQIWEEGGVGKWEGLADMTQSLKVEIKRWSSREEAGN